MGGYVGRFAPTPSGPLHFGSLLTAVASYLDARASGGSWKLRIDDLDTQRIAQGATKKILESLIAHRLHWDGDVAFQSHHVEQYRSALRNLENQALCFHCTCSRKDLTGIDVYPGTCRDRTLPEDVKAAIRIRAPQTEYGFCDSLHGHHAELLAQSVGDFIIARRDGSIAYQLAVVVDDHAMAITDIVRGADLIDNTPRQLFLMDCLRIPFPKYLHVPVVTEQFGVKLSKHTHSTAIDNRYPLQNLRSALDLLGQEPPRITSIGALLDWAVSHWRRQSIPHVQKIDNFVSL
jgi:glutamyl-Q tRNA(Asp) synthetase